MSLSGRTNTAAWTSLALVSLVTGYALLFAARPIAQTHGGLRERQEICIVLAGLLGVLHWVWSPRMKPAASPGWKPEWLVLLPVYAMFQALPLPLWAVRIVSPARARLVDALSPLELKPSWAPLSVTPSATVYHCLVLAACAIVFLVVYDIGGRFRARPWAVVVPLVILAAGEAVLGLVQVSQNRDPEVVAAGTYLIRNHYAGFLEMILPFAALQPLAILSRSRAQGRGGTTPLSPVLQACMGFGCAALILLGILSSLSRMGVLATLASMVFVALVALGRGRSWRQLWPVFATVMAVVTLALLLLPSEKLLGRFAEIDREGRVAAWRETRDLIMAYPLLGCGLGGYESAFVKYKASHALLDQDYAHNDYLQYLAELGLVGFAIGALPLVVILARLRSGWIQQSRPDAAWLCIACAGSTLAIGLHSFVDFNLYVPANMLVLAWILGLAACNGALGLRRLHDQTDPIPAASGKPGRSRHRP